MRYIFGIIACSIGALSKIILLTLLIKESSKRKDIIACVLSIVCDVIAIICFAMQMRLNSLA